MGFVVGTESISQFNLKALVRFSLACFRQRSTKLPTIPVNAVLIEFRLHSNNVRVSNQVCRATNRCLSSFPIELSDRKCSTIFLFFQLIGISPINKGGITEYVYNSWCNVTYFTNSQISSLLINFYSISTAPVKLIRYLLDINGARIWDHGYRKNFE